MKTKNSLLVISFSIVFVMNALAQCYPDRHNTTWFDGWVSCEESENPNPERGDSHWIMYDFNHVYGLGEVHIWNVNDNNHLDWGAQFLAVDYSLDGESWAELDQFTIPRSDGSSIYEGVDATDFNGQEARFVLLTVMENWGGDCSGFAEIRFEVTNPVGVAEETVADLMDLGAFPNPFKDNFTLSIKTTRPEALNYSLFDMYGRLVLNQKINNPRRENRIDIILAKQQNGVYNLIVHQGDKTKHIQVVKVD